MRLFVAVELPNNISNYLLILQENLKLKVGNLRFTKSFHLTLKFFGEIDNVYEIISRLETVTFKKFELQLTKIGVFPNIDHVRVIWVGLSSPPEIFKLSNDINKAFSQHEPNFEFKPHVTLARAKEIKGQIKDILTLKVEPLSFTVQECVLFESTLTPGGPVYKKLRIIKGS